MRLRCFVGSKEQHQQWLDDDDDANWLSQDGGSGGGGRAPLTKQQTKVAENAVRDLEKQRSEQDAAMARFLDYEGFGAYHDLLRSYGCESVSDLLDESMVSTTQLTREIGSKYMFLLLQLPCP